MLFLTGVTSRLAEAPSAAALGLLPASRVLIRAGDRRPEQALRAVVLLAGTLRRDAFRRGIGRLLVELPIDQQRSLLDIWHEQVRQLAMHLKLETLPLRVLIDRASPAPRIVGESRDNGAARVPPSIERDPIQLRGTGGLLRDVVAGYEPDDYVLVADAGQLLIEPLWSLYHGLARTAGDVRLLALPDGGPAGLSLIRCGCLRDLPEVGFVDFKEQALPRLAQRHEVRVARWRSATGLPLRTREGYLAAVRYVHGHRPAAVPQTGTLEPGRFVFRLIEQGAAVHGSAVVHDAVVLAGATVEPGAALVRSVVGPGARLRAGRRAVDTIVLARGRSTGE